MRTTLPSLLRDARLVLEKWRTDAACSRRNKVETSFNCHKHTKKKKKTKWRYRSQSSNISKIIKLFSLSDSIQLKFNSNQGAS